jgi:hypothetical protein
VHAGAASSKGSAEPNGLFAQRAYAGAVLANAGQTPLPAPAEAGAARLPVAKTGMRQCGIVQPSR